MPESIPTAAFVIGIVLFIAALIGTELKIAAVETPALNRNQRLTAGVIGIFLVGFGLTGGRLFGQENAPAPGTVVTPMVASAAGDGGTAQDCFSDLPESDRIVVAIENQRKTGRSFSSGQPRQGVMAVQFSRDGAIIGGLKFETPESGLGFDILSVVDRDCNPISTYENASRIDQPKEAPYNYDTLNYHFGDTLIAMSMAYGEGNDRIYLSAEEVSP